MGPFLRTAILAPILAGCTVGAHRNAPYYQEGFVRDFNEPLISPVFSVVPPRAQYAADGQVYYAIGSRTIPTDTGFTFMWFSDCYGEKPGITWLYGEFSPGADEPPGAGMQGGDEGIETATARSTAAMVRKFSCLPVAHNTEFGDAIENMGGETRAYSCRLAGDRPIHIGYSLSAITAGDEAEAVARACRTEAVGTLFDLLNSIHWFSG